jgi:DnaJ-class molecular chaperone
MGNHRANSHSETRSVCSLCNGTGWIWDYNITAEMDEKKVCYECDGKGYVEDDE